MPVKAPKAADEGLKEGANPSGDDVNGFHKPRSISPQAFELARLIVLQSREPEVAGVLADDLPEMMQATIDASKGREGGAATAARQLILKILRHPAASAADREAGDRGRPAALRGGLVGRLAGGAPRVIEGDPQGLGHAGVTAPGERTSEALPF